MIFIVVGNSVETIPQSEMRGARINEVAKAAKVSISTVSRVLNNSGYASQAVRERVNSAVKRLGFRQNRLASSLRRKTSGFIGLVIPDISNEFFATLAKYVEITLQKYNYGLFLCNTEENKSKERFYLESLCDTQVEAIILTTSQPEAAPELKHRELPIVFADRRVDLDRFHSGVCVTSDNFMGGYLAGGRLVDSGARRILVLRDNRRLYGVDQRQSGFLKATRDRGGKNLSVSVVETEVSSYAAEIIMERIISEQVFDAIFCTSDTIAFGALRALQARNMEVPEQVQVIGFDGTEIGAFFNPPLTTIRQDMGKMGTIIGEHAVSLIEKRMIPEYTIVPVELVERATTLPSTSS
jgi:LacI family transcriptional regulator, galactose operon repressor